MPGFGEGGFGAGGFGGYPLTPPSGHRTAQKIKLTAFTTTGLNESPFTGSQQVYQWQREGWRLDVALPPMKLTDAEVWVSFLTLLRGRAGTFLFGDTARKVPQGVATGSPLANGAGNIARSGILTTDGWTHSITAILKAGDYIQAGNRLYKNLLDVNSDGSGNAVLTIFPRLRETVADGTALVTSSAVGTFRLAADQTSWDIDQAKVYGVSFQAVEAL